MDFVEREAVLRVPYRLTAARLERQWAQRHKTEPPRELLREIDALAEEPPHPRIAAFCERLGMSELQQELWVTLLCLQCRLELGVQVGEMVGAYGRTAPPLSLLAMLVGPAWTGGEVMEALRPELPFVRYGLMTVHDSGRPLWERRVTIDEPVMAAFFGRPMLPPSLDPIGFVLDGHDAPLPEVDPAVHEAVAALLTRPAGDGAPTVYIVEGEPGVGRKSWLRHTAGRPLVVSDLSLVAGAESTMTTVIREALREAWLREALCYFELGAGIDTHGGAASGDADEKKRAQTARPTLRERHQLEQLLASFPGDAAVGVSPQDGWTWSRLGERAVRVVVGAPSPELQAAAWELDRKMAPGVTGEMLARRFPLPLRGIHRVKDLVTQRHRAGTPPSAASLTQVARRWLNQETGRLATAISTDLGWDDLVLPSDLRALVEEIIRFARHRDLVLEAYGMRRWSKGGLHVLLAGEPGTGKTTLATLLGRAIGRETLKVNLDQVFSRYVGETEKHLVQVFALAERSRSLLLLDEADSLLAKRTEVKGANDRFGNLAVNVVLQLMEEYNVVSVATTNRESGLDDASLRRFSYRMTVPRPDQPMRAELFRRMVPQNVLIDDEIDWDHIASQVDVTGGIIRNIMMRMAALTAANDGHLTLNVCFESINSELKQLGRLPLRF